MRQRNVRRAFMGLKTFMKLSQLLNYGTTVKVLRPSAPACSGLQHALALRGAPVIPLAAACNVARAGDC